jgi:hypothetical protein
MTFPFPAHGAALAALLLVCGCGQSASTEMAAPAPKQSGPALASTEIARPPAIPDDANAVAAAPLNDAGEIASEIASNTMIARVPVEGGLAWVQDGDVVRTVSGDGRRVSYFHPGESRPFLVQTGGLAYAYDHGQAQLAYDDRGRPAPVSDAARAEAERLADQSRREREEAERAGRGTGDR